MPPPLYQPPRTQAAAPDPPADRPHQQGTSDSSTAERRTYDFRNRAKDGAVTTAPLREVIQLVPQPDGTSITARAFQFVPFSSADLVNWRSNNPSYSENPQKLTELCESIMNSHCPTWGDCRQLMMSLFSREERTRIYNEAAKILKEKVPTGQNEATWIATKCPETDPKWDYNNEEQLEKLKDYQQLLIEAMRAGMKKPVNLSKISEIRQEASETPDHFYERLLDTYQCYTPLEVSEPANQRLINMAFVAKSYPDIKQKLQRQEGFAGMPISFLLELAWCVFNNRDKAERKEQDQHAQWKSQLLAAALVQSTSSGLTKPGKQEEGPRKAKPNECFNCFETTHRVANCPYPRRSRKRGRGKKKHLDTSGPLQPQQNVTAGQVHNGVYQPAPRQPPAGISTLNPSAPSYQPH